MARHPLRERLRGQLMLALYRCGPPGRSARGLPGSRRALVEELGIEPGPALQRSSGRCSHRTRRSGPAAAPAAAAPPRRRSASSITVLALDCEPAAAVDRDPEG